MTTHPEIVFVKGENSQFTKLEKLVTSNGYKVKCVEQPEQVLAILKSRKSAVIIADLSLNGKDALDLLKEIDANRLKQYCSVIILSDRKENYVEIAAINGGADDFMVKPVNKRVFLSRLNMWIRHHLSSRGFSSVKDPNDSIVLDHDRYLLISNGNEIILKPKEFRIVSLLASKPRKVFSRDEIKDLVWDASTKKVNNRTIDVHIRNLRVKIGEDCIKTYKGFGYSFEASIAN